MKQNLFGEKVSYENFAPPFVLIALISRFVNRYQSAANAFFKELSWQQMFFLNGVTLFKEAPSIKDMADFLGCTHQNANKLYAKLLQDGYIVSQQDGNDRRKQYSHPAKALHIAYWHSDVCNPENLPYLLWKEPL